jgi:glycosyltransferase involved in cell wall biosynthesis
MHTLIPPPRVAIVRHDRFPGEPHLLRSVHALRDAGFDVDVICDHEPGRPRHERSDGVTVLRLLFPHKRHSVLRYLAEYATLPVLAGAIVAARCLRRRYDYVEIDNPPDWLVLAGLIPRMQGSKVVLYMFENMPELLAADRGWSSGHPLMRALVTVQRVSAGLAHCLIAPHEMARRVLVDQGIPSAKIAAVVPNVPDERVFLARLTCSKADGARRKQPARSSAFRLVTHGTLLQRYGIQTLLEAVAALRSRIPGLHLQIIGDGEYRPALEQLAARLALGDVVTFSGHVPFDQVAPALEGAAVGIVPMWAPFVPNKLMEYLALGLPVIATDWPSLRLYFDDKALFYVPPKNVQALADAIMVLYGDPQQRAALAATARAVYRARFAWERTKRAYLAVYGVEAGDRRGARGEGRGAPDWPSALPPTASPTGASPPRAPHIRGRLPPGRDAP